MGKYVTESRRALLDLEDNLNKTLTISDEKRVQIHEAIKKAYDLMPLESIENTPIKEENVVCKLLLKGYPQHLMAALEPVLKSLVVRNTKTGNTDFERTNEYVMTLMLEKVKKP